MWSMPFKGIGPGFESPPTHQPSLERSESEGCRAEAQRRRANNQPRISYGPASKFLSATAEKFFHFIFSQAALDSFHQDWDAHQILGCSRLDPHAGTGHLSLIHISEPTRRTPISYAVFCLKKKKH